MQINFFSFAQKKSDHQFYHKIDDRIFYLCISFCYFFTVTLNVAFAPLFVVTVMVAFPAFLPTTLPLLFTVATFVLELL